MSDREDILQLLDPAGEADEGRSHYIVAIERHISYRAVWLSGAGLCRAA